MSRHKITASRASNRRVTQRRKAALPDIPVLVPGSDGSAVAPTSAAKNGDLAQPDPMEEQIRRMIEAAYT